MVQLEQSVWVCVYVSVSGEVAQEPSCGAHLHGMIPSARTAALSEPSISDQSVCWFISMFSRSTSKVKVVRKRLRQERTLHGVNLEYELSVFTVGLFLRTLVCALVWDLTLLVLG